MPPTTRPSRSNRRRRNMTVLAVLPLSLGALACGDGGGSNTTTTPAALQTNPVFVAAGTSDAAAGGRTLRVSVGSPLPVGQTAVTSGGARLDLGPGAIRP